MNILISGSSGFIGSNLKDYLKKVKPEYNLFCLGRGLIDSDSEISWGNISDGILDKIEIIIHLAGKAHDTKNTSSEQEYFDVNVGLTKKIFQHFLKSSASKFIFFSSVKAVADSVRDEFLTEDMLANPQTPYGKSKLQAEQYILSIQLPPGKRVYILRPCMIHGPGNKGNLNLLYKLSEKGLPWPLGAFDNKRSFTSMQNLQFVIQEFIEKDIESGTYQIADDETISTNDLIYLMADSLNRKARIWNVSPNTIKLIAKMGDNLGLPLNSERLKKLTESYIVSNQKLKVALGIKKMPYTANDGLKKTFASFL